jgi:hypothetical protein
MYERPGLAVVLWVFRLANTANLLTSWAKTTELMSTTQTLERFLAHLAPAELSLVGGGREPNPGPPALQANTLSKEPFERRY